VSPEMTTKGTWRTTSNFRTGVQIPSVRW
jgi:hypothetical protein